MRKKSDLPQKICVVCGRPFAWRKKWERDWAAVTVCSERCRRAKRSTHTGEPRGATGVREAPDGL